MIIMFNHVCVLFLLRLSVEAEQMDALDVVDMTRPTDWIHLSAYYEALNSNRKMCHNCGAPTLGTALHLDHSLSLELMHPAVIPSEFFVTRVNLIDVSSLSHGNKSFVLTLENALKWTVMKQDSKESTLLLFKFGWNHQDSIPNLWNCHCKIPGLSFEVAEWIALNMPHVVGVATDAPSLESDQTRDFAARTVADMLGKSGVYMIENVLITKNLPDQSCLAIISPLKLLNANYVPATVTAFCPTVRAGMQVSISLRRAVPRSLAKTSRMYDVNLDEIMQRSKRKLG